MSASSSRPGQLSPLKQALLALEEMQAKLDAAERSRREPIAIIGMGCRFPGGAHDPEAFWSLLRDGVDAVQEIPRDRWDVDATYDPDPDAPGKMSTRWGAFLEDVYGFDPQFFGIAPREATSMDPQQRILLEVAWEALEHAGQAPDRLSGSRTGVFVGICRGDYAQLQTMAGDPGRFDLYYASGQAHSIAAGRLSYVLGLQGPSVALDTACSSSLVALHLAVQSLRLGECDGALVGGANLILSPENGITFSKGRMLAADGRCKTFDAKADGFVEGEGFAVVVLKRLSDAQAAGDRILATIRGTAVNQDGPSSGLTAPNGPAQQAVIREALANGGVDARDVSYVEAHGTGTSLGDPIEVQAIAAVLGVGHGKDDPLVIGSVKTNVGHLESSAGIAGLVKVVLALQHQEIPPHLHFREPNPFIPWNELPVKVPTERLPWTASRGRRVAGLSSFGFSGTNAHVVVEEAPAVPPASPGPERPLHLLALSARSEAALVALAGRHEQRFTAEPAASLADVCYTANAGRAHQSHRLAIVAPSAEEMQKALAGASAGVEVPGLTRGPEPVAGRPKVAFLFTGQGSQYPGMGRGLYESQPTFRRALDRCDEILRGALERPLLSVLYGNEEDSSHLHDTAYTQPALFAVEYALSDLWRSFGIEPAAVFGHSVGEYVAACVAGVFSLEDGLGLIAERARLMQALPRDGEMAAIFAPESRARAALSGHESQLSIAAVNGPESVVLSGERGAMTAVLKRLAEKGVRSKKLTVSHAFHSPLMEPMLEAFAKAASKVAFQPPRIALISNVTGLLARRGEVEQASYWVRHAREAVQFLSGMQTLEERGCRVFLEVGPSPTLLGMGRRCVSNEESAAFLPSLREGREDWAQMLESVSSLYVRGAELDWAGFDHDYPRRKVSLPTYPFQRRTYRFEAAAPRRSAGARQPDGGHPLLGRRMRSPLIRESLFETTLSVDALPFLPDHRVYGNVVVPGAALVEMMGAAAFEARGHAYGLEDIVIREALVLREGETRTVQTLLIPDRDQADLTLVQIITLPDDPEDGHVVHATARVGTPVSPVPDVALEALRARCPETVDVAAYYDTLEERGIQLGPCFRGIEELWSGSGESLGRIRLPEVVQGERGYRIHPVLLDAGLQIIAAALGGDDDAGEDVFMHLGLTAFRLHGSPPARLWSHAVIFPNPSGGRDTLSANIRLLDDEGGVIAEIEGLQLKRVDAQALERGAERAFDDWLYRVEWPPRPGQAEAPPSSPEYMPTPSEIAATVAPRIEELSARHGLPAYDPLLPRLDALSAAYVVDALRKLGWEPKPGERVSAPVLAERLRVAPQHRRLLGRLLEMLAEDGVLEGQGPEWKVRRVPTTEDPDATWRRLVAEFPSGGAELALTGRCGERLADVLRGECDPLGLLFPGGSLENAEKLYQESPPSRVYQALAQQAVSAAVAALPPGRTVRVLEIGAGTGGTTSYVVPQLPREATEYVFTDVSPLFTAKAEAKFREYPFMRYQILDIEREPDGQGLSPHHFDLILAANVLHATKDLGETMKHVKHLLAPGGLLVLSEIVARQRWIDLTFGLLDGWWRFVDTDLRPSYPLLTRPEWLRLFEAQGFVSSGTIPEAPQGEGILAQHVVFLARGPEAAVSAPKAEPPGRWLILEDGEAGGERLAELLEARGQSARIVSLDGAGATPRASAHAPAREHIDPRRRLDYQRLVREWSSGGGPRLRGVVHLSAADETTSSSADESALQACGSVLHLVQALGGAFQTDPPGLWLVTRGAQPVDEGSPLALAQAPLWGMAKVISLEHPELRCTRIDLPETVDSGDALQLVAELLNPDGEDQIAYRRGIRRAARLVRCAPTALQAPSPPGRLHVTRPGVLDSLTLRPEPRRPPARGEVEIRVRAAGLNFRDVLNALGMRSDEDPLGGECAGTVTAVGEGVEGLRVGQDVIAVAAGCFAEFVTVGTALVVPKPAALGFEEAATLPLAFLTADYALNRIAKMAAGDRVLIHAAAGGVGMAAVQLALRAGAEVFATAGSAEKRAYLAKLGIRHVLDSRSLAFADEVKERTQGRGVQVVLNSLAGEFIPKGLSTLAAGGRFLEIGKAGIWEPARVSAFRPDIQYFVVDLAETLHQNPAAVRPLLLDLVRAVEEQRLAPLPRRTFALADAPLAFRHMAQARHIGKVVLVPPAENRNEPVRFRSDASYLITGGLRGLGVEVARWMAERGAKHLILMGRRAPSPETELVLRAIEGLGGHVRVVQGDVSHEADLAAALSVAGESWPPLRGVFHSAGVLEDGVLLQQDWDRYARVLAPKVTGGWHLHRLTQNQPLDFFVLFSSVSSLLGSAGQSNHAAANAFLDALAHHRRALGLPALSINWGAWSEVGAAAEREVGRRITAQGVRTFNPREGLRVLEHLFRQPQPQVGVIPVQWSRFLQGSAAGRTRFYDEMAVEARRTVRPRAEPAVRRGLKERLEEAPPAQRQKLILAHVQDQAMKVLGLDSTQPIDPRQPLNELGLDSLMAVELRNLLGTGLGVTRTLPATLVFDYPAIVDLAQYLAREVFSLEDTAGPRGGRDEEDDALDRIESLSDEEVERLLSRKAAEGPRS